MSKVEIVDIFSDSGVCIGTVSRDEAERESHTIQNVIAFIFNSAGEVWIQKRPKNKTFGGLWDASTCGGVKHKEESDDAAKREQEEEMGYVSELLLVESFINHSVSNDGSRTRKFLTKLFIGRDERIPSPNEDVDEFQKHEPTALLNSINQSPSDYVPTLGLELKKAVSYINLLPNNNL